MHTTRRRRSPASKKSLVRALKQGYLRENRINRHLAREWARLEEEALQLGDSMRTAFRKRSAVC